MAPPTLDLVTSADARFVAPLGALLASISRTQRVPCVVHVIATGIGAEDRKRLEQLADVRWLTVDQAQFKGANVPRHMAVASFWRLLIPTLLTNSTRVLYLDADIMVRRPLEPLFGIALGDALVGAVRDAVVPWFGAPLGPPWNTLGVAPSTTYFNAGVLLFDVATWLDAGVGATATGLLRAHRLPHGDQCALNTAMAERWQSVSPTWNLQAGHLDSINSLASVVVPAAELSAAVADPAVVHFNASRLGRPWQANCTHPFADEWVSHLATTPWANLPLDVGRRRTPIAYRVRRAAYVLLDR